MPLLRLLLIIAMTSPLAHASAPTVTAHPFGRLPTGQEVQLYTLSNGQDLTAEITNYGGIMTRLFVPDRKGHPGDIVLGYDRLESYLASTPYFGALIGRVGNRIAAGKFTLEGRTYQLATNNDPGGQPCSLHGGVKGFDKVLWQAHPEVRNGEAGLRLEYRSPDGEEGFPGNLAVTVWYWLTPHNELRIEYQATTDHATPVNLTQHNYYNLAGDGDVSGHVLTLKASRFTPVNAGLIPLGALAPVQGTPFDFTQAHPIGDHLNDPDAQLRLGPGYDHNWVLDRHGAGLQLAAEVYEPVSGRTMEVWTEEPGVQFYSGNFLDGTLTGKGGVKYQQHTGFCLETQHFPDSPNQATFPSITLHPGETYLTKTVYRFGTR